MAWAAREVGVAVYGFMRRAIAVAWVTIVIGAGMFAFKALWNRSPPFAVLSVDAATARPGDYVRIYASVWRDPTRQCSLNYNRYLYDRDGLRYDMGSSSASFEAIAAVEAATPGRLAVAVQLPPSILPGRARILTELAYRCNYAQNLFPIELSAELPFYVLPPP